MPVPVERDLLEVIARLGSGLLCGGAIGLNRDLRNKPAGLRTHAIVALGAALITLVSIDLSGPYDSGAVTRTIQGIITGIGFVGAGVILQPERTANVVGLTTAASVWMVACLGAACGGGQLIEALVGTTLCLVVLTAGGPLEGWLVRRLGNRDNGNGGGAR